MKLGFLTQLVNADKIGGWVRAAVAAAFVAAVAKWPILGAYVDPAVQTQVAAAVAAVVVGYWSQLTKTPEAKVAMVNELAKDSTSPVQGVVMADTEAGKELAAKIDGPVEVAGTQAAIEIAKA